MRLHEIVFQTDAKNVSFLSCKTKKNISKKIDLGRSQYQDKKALLTVPMLMKRRNENSNSVQCAHLHSLWLL